MSNIFELFLHGFTFGAYPVDDEGLPWGNTTKKNSEKKNEEKDEVVYIQKEISRPRQERLEDIFDEFSKK
jgi:hypothetical protein